MRNSIRPRYILNHCIIHSTLVHALNRTKLTHCHIHSHQTYTMPNFNWWEKENSTFLPFKQRLHICTLCALKRWWWSWSRLLKTWPFFTKLLCVPETSFCSHIRQDRWHIAFITSKWSLSSKYESVLLSYQIFVCSLKEVKSFTTFVKSPRACNNQATYIFGDVPLIP